MRTAAETLGSSNVSEKLKNPLLVAVGIYIVNAITKQDGPHAFYGKATLAKMPEKRTWEIAWKANYKGKQIWEFENADKRYKAETPFSVSPDTDTNIRSALSGWLNKHKLYQHVSPATEDEETVTEEETGPVVEEETDFVGEESKTVTVEPAPRIAPKPAVVEKPKTSPAADGDMSRRGALIKKSISELVMLPVAMIRPFKGNPRKLFLEGEQGALKECILQEGQNAPIEVIEIHDDPKHLWQIVKGERRWRTFVDTKKEFIEAIIRPRELIPDEKAQRRWCFTGDSNQAKYKPVEWALAMLQDQTDGATIKELSKRSGRSHGWVSSVLRLNKLHPDLLRLLNPTLPRKEQISITVAYYLAGVPQENQLELYKQITSVGGAQLQIVEARRLIEKMMPGQLKKTHRKPADYTKSMMSAVERMTADAIKVDDFPESAIESLISNQPEQVGRLSDQVETAMRHLQSIQEKLAAHQKSTVAA